MCLESVAVHYVDNLGGYGPAYLLVAGVLALIAVIAIKYMPFWKECKLRRLAIEDEREKRKSEEAQLRAERERENASLASRQIDSQNRSTAAMTAMTQQMALTEARIEASQRGSMAMAGKVDDMAVEVHDIHAVVVSKDKI